MTTRNIIKHDQELSAAGYMINSTDASGVPQYVSLCELVGNIGIGTYEATDLFLAKGSGVAVTGDFQQWSSPSGNLNNPFFGVGNYELTLELNGTLFTGNSLGTANGGHVTALTSLNEALVWFNNVLASNGSTAILASNGSDLIWIVDSNNNPTGDAINIMIFNSDVGEFVVKAYNYVVATITATGIGDCKLVQLPQTSYEEVVNITANVPHIVQHNLKNSIGIYKAIHLQTGLELSPVRLSKTVDDVTLLFNTDLTQVEITYLT